MKKNIPLILALILASPAYSADNTYTNGKYGFSIPIPAGAYACPTAQGLPNHGVRIVRTQSDCAQTPFNPNEIDIAANYNVTGGTSVADVAKALCGKHLAISAYKIGTDGVMLCNGSRTGKTYISLHRSGQNAADWIVYTLHIGKIIDEQGTKKIFATIRHLK